MSGTTRSNFWLFAACATAALLSQGSGAANAQESGASAADEIVVTATRRDQALQDVPLAVTPVTAAMIENSGIRDIQDLTSVAPSLQFNVSENETSATARLRGVGTQGSNPGLESAVGIFVDGVYRARNGVALSDLGEVSQIEVLRGPQGTLFGRNTSAGLITINTAKPNLSSMSADAELTYGDFNELRVAGSVNLPLVQDVLGVRLFAAQGSRDGFVDLNPAGANPTLTSGNAGRGESNNRDFWTVRGQMLWEPTATFGARLIVDYSERDEVCCAAKIYNPRVLNGATPLLSGHNTLAGGGIPTDPFQPNVTGVSSAGQANAVAGLGGYGTGGLANVQRGNGDIGDRFAFANRAYDQQLTDQGISLELNWDLGGLSLTSVTAYRDWLYDQGQDADFSQADLWYRLNNGQNGFGFEVFTQEFRAAFDIGPIDSIVGVFYSDETLTRRDALQNGSQFGTYFSLLNPLFTALGPTSPLTANNTGIRDTYEQAGESIALFTHNIWEVDDSTDITIGLRFTREEKDVVANFRTSYDSTAALTATLNGVGAGLGTAFGNCFGALPGGAANAAVIGARGVYCIPTLRNGNDGIRRQSREENEFSGVISARRTFTDNISGYVSYSRGYKGGGFNLDRDFSNLAAGSPPGSTWTTNFPAEFVDAFELGSKTEWFNRRMLLNVATFYNEYTNFQLNTFNGVSFQVSPIPEVTAQGVEVDTTWRTPIDGLMIQGGLAYTEAEYGDNTGWVAQSANPLNPANQPVNYRLPGSRLTNSPLWTVTSAFTYERPIFGDLNGLAYLDFRYASDQVTGSDLEPTKIQPGFFLVNGRIGVSTPNERFGVELWGRNLLDESYQQIAFNVPLQGNARGAFLGDPRTFGITLRAEY